MLREKSVYNSINSYSNDDRQLESTTKYTNTNIEIDRLRYIPVTTKEVYYDALTGQSKTVNHTYETNKVRQKGNLLRTIVITGKNSQKTEYSDFVPNVNGIVDFLPKTKLLLTLTEIFRIILYIKLVTNITINIKLLIV